jgi:hypothetical protein
MAPARELARRAALPDAGAEPKQQLQALLASAQAVLHQVRADLQRLAPAADPAFRDLMAAVFTTRLTQTLQKWANELGQLAD